MKRRGAVLILFLLLGAAGVSGWLLWPSSSDSLNAQERWGKQIYFEGTSPSGKDIKAYIGAAQVELPGSAATCASCHGADGLGRPEAGVIPSDITWDYLMRRYGHTHPKGRSHPAFTEASLKRCILTGYDPAGNRLDPSMPTYSMSAEDINALVAYMKRLQSDLDPGITETSIKIGMAVPAHGPMGEIGQGMHDLVAAYFKEVNSRGGIYQRRLDLVKAVFDNTRESALSGITRLVEKERVFALVGSVIVGADREVAQWVESHKMPLVGPFGLMASDPLALNEHTFYLLSGVTEQVRALVDFAAGHLKVSSPRLAVVESGGAHDGELVAAILEQCGAYGWTGATRVAFAGGGPEAAATAAGLKQAGADLLVYLSSGGLKSLLEEADKMAWHPYVLMPGSLLKGEMLQLPLGFQGKLHLSYPALPADQTPGGIGELQALLHRHGLAMRHRTSQVSAFVAARVLVEGLKGSGRDLRRDALVRALERIRDFDTGLYPPITYGPNRRIGALGSYVVTIDLEKGDFVPVGGWMSVSER